MTGDRGRRIRELFDRAVSLAGDERARLLDEASAGDPELRRDVESLLLRDPRSADLPVSPLFDPPRGEEDAAGGSFPEIEGYRILGRVGAGGMGVVYEAEQLSPRRRVALKVLRGGELADDLRRRLFLREIQTLARLDHPGIARIYESGQTRDGRLFFSMELVKGVPLDRFIGGASAESGPDRAVGASRRAGRDRVLTLFRRICEAVHFAHQRGVIHRDLKPSNIVLVDEAPPEGGDAAVPVPKILDFGLARITEPGAELSFATEVGAIRGTLQYMSPEQARGIPGEVDLRSDVYSLGMILYQLLTGKVPYTVSEVSVPEALRRICEVEPPSLRRARPDAPWLDADLEALTAKALAKDAGRRYQSAHALTEDVTRHLEARPLEARPPSTTYQIRKFVARHKGGFAVAAALLVVLLLGIAGTTTGMLRARRAEEVAKKEALTAQKEARTAQAVSDFLVDLLRGADPWQSKGRTTIREVLDRASEKARDGLKDQPEVRARLLGMIGQCYSNLGLYPEARPILEEAIAGYERALGPDAPEIVESLNRLGHLHINSKEFPAARRVLERALAIGERSRPSNDGPLGFTLYLLGVVLDREGDFNGAREYLKRSVAARERAFGPQHARVAASLATLAENYEHTGEFDSASALYERALPIMEKAGGPKSPHVAAMLDLIGILRNRMGDPASAVGYFERAVAIQEEVLGPDHPNLARMLDNLGGTLAEMGDAARARPLIERGLAIKRKVFDPGHFEFALSFANLAKADRAAGDLASARAHSKRAIAIVESTRGPKHPALVEFLDLDASILRDLGQTAAARTIEARAQAIRDEGRPPS